MSTILDTHLLIWLAGLPERLPRGARQAIEDPEAELYFSAVSIWEVAIKSASRENFSVDPHVLRNGLLGVGYLELAVTGAHAAATALLPPIHQDPFDRLLVAQAAMEGMTLMTADTTVARYPGPILLV